nr:MAG TPA: hypothetical protein [Caudoviricetes sp.]
MKDYKEIEKALNERFSHRSAWDRGVNDYALSLYEDFLERNLEVLNVKEFETICLNGAESWEQFSCGGCSLIYNGDIAAALCTPSELKRTKNGLYDPNKHENWCDVQARALKQAFKRLSTVYFEEIKAC